MKTFFLITTMISGTLFFSSGAFAQETTTSTEPSPSPKFGIKGGLNLSNLYVDDVDDENVKVGFNAGVYAKIPVARWFSVQPELLYSSKGAKLSYNNILFGQGEYRYNLGYVELPVLAVFNVHRNISLHAGGYAGYLVNANIKDLKDNGTVDEIADLDEDNFERFDAGLAGGVAIDVENFSIGARYNYGLKEIGKSGNISTQLFNNAKNNNLSIYLAFGFSIFV